MRSPEQRDLVDELRSATRALLDAVGPDLASSLTRREHALAKIKNEDSGDVPPAELRAILTEGRAAFVRLRAEQARVHLRIQELQTIRSGLTQFRPRVKRPPTLAIQL